MPQITIDADIKDALAAGTISWAEAGELRDLRKEKVTYERRVGSWRTKKPLEPDLGRLRELEAQMKLESSG